jgi:Spy/CpxP family protein refolding chaperone
MGFLSREKFHMEQFQMGDWRGKIAGWWDQCNVEAHSQIQLDSLFYIEQLQMNTEAQRRRGKSLREFFGLEFCH